MRIVKCNLNFVVCQEPDSKSRFLGCQWETDMMRRMWWWTVVALDFLIKENSPKIDSENLSVLLSMYIKNHANKSTQKENNNENIINNNHDNDDDNDNNDNK